MIPPLPQRARFGRDGRLLDADEALLALNRALGGALATRLAIPTLRDQVDQSLRLGVRLARAIEVVGPWGAVKLWCESRPDAEGVTLDVHDWRQDAAMMQTAQTPRVAAALAGEGYIRLDHQQRIVRFVPPEGVKLGLNEDRYILAPIDALLEWDGPLPDAGQADLGLHHRSVRLIGSDLLWLLDVQPDTTAAGTIRGHDLFLLPAAAPMEGEADPLLPAEDAERLFNEQIGPALRRPIGRIIAQAESIGGRLAGPIRSEYAAYAADIASAGRHLLGLVDDLADLEAIDTPGFRVETGPIDLADTTRRAAQMLLLRAQERGITLVVKGGEGGLGCHGDERRVLQILLNLIGNAINYGPANSRVTVYLTAEGSCGLATVADEGTGLTVDQQARLFRKWERLGRSGDGGSGLGLYISRRLAEAMGGTLNVTSQPGQGARFTLSLPR